MGGGRDPPLPGTNELQGKAVQPETWVPEFIHIIGRTLQLHQKRLQFATSEQSLHNVSSHQGANSMLDRHGQQQKARCIANNLYIHMKAGNQEW